MLESKPLGFHRHLPGRTMTQQFQGLPGHIPRFLPPNRFPASALGRLPSRPCGGFSRAVLPSSEFLPAPKTGSSLRSPGAGARKECVSADTPAAPFPFRQRCLPSAGASCDRAARLDLFTSSEEVTHLRKPSLCPPPSDPPNWRCCGTFTKNIRTT